MKINQKIKKVAFIGMGLINSSLARDLKIKKFYLASSAYSRRLSTINKIKKLKLVDFASSNIEKTIKEADIIIVGIPVAAYQEVFKKICNNIKPGAIITDVGSVKKEVINSVKKYIPKNVDFVPGHPIAGTENSGPESGFAGLFKNGWCILTPNKNTSKNSVKIIKYMWQLVGMKVDIMDSNYHDEVLAITSHIPHIIAYSIVGTIANLQTTIKKEVIKYAASGFRDFTRIAASDPIMWRDIILYNRQSILKMLNLFKKDLSKLEYAIENNDDKFLLNLFTKTRKIRKDIIK
ncbi:MAG: cyclohexadienyl dehydrogenase [Alphaproteobacteria bacterium]|nr:MAG: cyclohexadienyl dehydrogenase [Alphaproteobacteria bacterium]